MKSASNHTVPSVEFWKNKNVFLTGHTGFIGGWLTVWLNHLGAKVHGYSLLPNTKPSFFTACGVDLLCKHEIGDIRDLKNLSNAIKQATPDIALHLAAQALVRPAFKDPIETYSTNVQGTVNFLHALRETKKLKSIVVFTTDKVYENIEIKRGYKESDRLGGFEPYGVSKACAELVTKSYWQSYFSERCAITTIRAGNVIGGGDWSEDRLIPDAIRAFSKKQALEIRHPQAIRPWQHVLEACNALLLAAEKMYNSKPTLTHFNIGPSEKEAKTVGWIADRMIKDWNKSSKSKVEWKKGKTDQIYEAKLLMLNNNLAQKQLRWHPTWTTIKALKHTVEWYQLQQQRQKMLDVSISQLQDFMKDAKNE